MKAKISVANGIRNLNFTYKKTIYTFLFLVIIKFTGGHCFLIINNLMMTKNKLIYLTKIGYNLTPNRL